MTATTAHAAQLCIDALNTTATVDSSRLYTVMSMGDSRPVTLPARE
ncbi:hypothetical protein [Pseudomonas canadensis]